MAKPRKTAEGTAVAEGPDVFDSATAAQQQEATSQPMIPEAQEIVQSVAAAHAMPPENGHAAQHARAIEKKKYTPPADPFGFESIKAGKNRVHLLKSEGEGAWVIRFDHNPNDDKGLNGEEYSKTTPHPVLKMLKEDGYRWGFDGNDGKGGWGKAFSGDAYQTDHMEARRVLQKAAEMIGQDRGPIPD